MRFAKFSKSLTSEAGFHCKDSKVGIRADGSYRYVLQGIDWELRVLDCLERDNYKCVICAGQDGLDPHHKFHKGKGGGDDLANLETRCRACHNEAHPEKQVRWTKTKP